MFALDLGEVFLEGEVFGDVEGFASRAEVGEAATAGVLEVGEGGVGDAGDTEFGGPVLAVAFGDAAVEAAIETEAHFVDGGGIEGVSVGEYDIALIERTDVDVTVDDFDEFADWPFFAAMADLGVAAEETMVDVELMVDLNVETHEVKTAAGIVSEVIDGASGLDGTGIGGGAPGFKVDDFLCDGVEEVGGDDVAGERIASPSAVDQTSGEGVVDREAATAEVEIAIEHVVAGDRDDDGFAVLFVMLLEAGELEGFVADDGTGGGGTPLVVGEGAGAGELFEESAVDEFAVGVAGFDSAMEGVATASEDGAELAAGGVAEFGGSAGGPHFEFQNGIEGGDHGAREVADLTDDGFLAADAVHRVDDGSLALADGVLAVDVGHAGHVEEDAVDDFLHDGQLFDNFGIEDLTGAGGFGFEKREGGIEADGVGDLPTSRRTSTRGCSLMRRMRPAWT